MKYLIVLSIFYYSVVHAGIVQDQIAKILPGNSPTKENLILLSRSGRVLRTSNTKLIDALSAIRVNDTVSFVEKDDQIITFAKTEAPLGLATYYDDDLPNLKIANQPTTTRYTDANFLPSNLKYVSDAQNLMNELKDNIKSGSECYQRAHLWALEMNQMANIHSQKIFLFFSEKYMREYSFGWWFHVAPFVLVNEQELVIDPRFFDQPTDTQHWSNFFMPSHPICKTVSKYRDYEDHQEDEYCYFRKLPMYYFEPTEVENRDNSDSIIADWILWQTESAYDALKRARWWKRI